MTKKVTKTVSKKVVKKVAKKVVKVSKTPNVFKVGDIVVGNDLASKKYRITQKGYKGKVTKVLIELDGCYHVDSECFDFVKKPALNKKSK